MSKFPFQYPAGPERNFKIVQLGRPKGRPDYFRAGLACPACPLATPLFFNFVSVAHKVVFTHLTLSALKQCLQKFQVHTH